MGSANQAHPRRQGSVMCYTGRVYIPTSNLQTGELIMDDDFDLLLYGQKRTKPTSIEPDWMDIPKPDFKPFGD